MEIKINECNSLGAGFLEDLAKYSSLPKWLEAIRDDTVSFFPLDCSVRVKRADGDITYSIVSSEAKGDIDTAIRTVTTLPPERRNFPNDTAEIVVNAFERELYFII